MNKNRHTAHPDEAQIQTLSRRGFLKTSAALSLGSLLAGCSKGSDSSGKVTLTQWYHQYGEDGTREAVNRYAIQYMKENPNVVINVVWVPGDYNTKLNTALLVAGGPDIFESSHLSVPMVVAEQVAPLDDLFPPDIKNDFLPSDLTVNSVNGKIYGVKMVGDTGLIYYRKSLLDKAGIKPPENVDELIEAAKKLTIPGRKGLYMGNDGGVSALLNIAPWSAGEQFLVNNKLVFNTPRTGAAYKKIRELNDSGALLIGAPTDWWDPAAFNQELCAMAWGGLWSYPAIKKALGDDVGGMAWPKFDDKGAPSTFAGGWSQMVNSRSPHTEEAKKYVQWLWIKSAKTQQDWNLSYGFHVPPRRSVASEAAPLQAGVPAQAAKDLAEHGGALPPAWTNGMGTALTDAATNIIKLGADPEAELASATRKCQRELDRQLR